MERERVRRAIEQPVAEAVRLLDQAQGADSETRLMMLINGWGRGLAAGLEELALEVESSRHTSQSGSTPSATLDKPGTRSSAAAVPAEQSDGPRRPDADEESLRARAAESRKATAALRDESSSELRGGGHEIDP
jgi:hypothetical protein